MHVLHGETYRARHDMWFGSRLSESVLLSAVSARVEDGARRRFVDAASRSLASIISLIDPYELTAAAKRRKKVEDSPDEGLKRMAMLNALGSEGMSAERLREALEGVSRAMKELEDADTAG